MRLLSRTAALAAPSNTRTMVVFIPPDFVVDKALGETYAKGQGVDMKLVDLDQPARLLGRRLRDVGITVLNPTRHFEALIENGTELYGKVDRHLNRRGHHELARFIAPAVIEELSNRLGDAPVAGRHRR